ncbi:hypothetical protein O7626_13125 [Micromonospora sp. WMMD1102]|uniref:hypothetical protein n=1 Tax=Micromonospora sp. WMMD1102 TaxID=3016105 RepID=UPI002414E05A|nr:hypothetical protein [Micromonospora sp. WMMD1102]MDG4786860.1 hypothetical protein [Micromonospora sp. WMMD1102]
MKRLFRHLTAARPHHRRDWRRFWRYCRCGWRWRCPESRELVPTPYQPPPPVELTEVERTEIRTLSAVPAPDTPDASPPPAGDRMRNRRPWWDAPTRSHLANGRTGGLMPGQEYRARRGARV